MYVGAEAYNHYAHTLHSQEWFVKLAETGLFIVFATHLYLALATMRDNKNARSQTYEVKETKQEGREWNLGADTWMFISGVVVLGFLILHLWDFTLERRSDIEYEGKEPFEKAIAILSSPISGFVYLIGSIILGFHLSHGFSSAFQTLGINHPKYNMSIKVVGAVFAAVIGIGFASFATWGLYLMMSVD